MHWYIEDNQNKQKRHSNGHKNERRVEKRSGQRSTKRELEHSVQHDRIGTVLKTAPKENYKILSRAYTDFNRQLN